MGDQVMQREEILNEKQEKEKSSQIKLTDEEISIHQENGVEISFDAFDASFRERGELPIKADDAMEEKADVNKRNPCTQYSVLCSVLLVFALSIGIALGLTMPQQQNLNKAITAATLDDNNPDTTSTTSNNNEDVNTERPEKVDVAGELESLVNETLVPNKEMDIDLTEALTDSTISPTLSYQRESEVNGILIQHAVFVGTEFDDLNSYQNKSERPLTSVCPR